MPSRKYMAATDDGLDRTGARSQIAEHQSPVDDLISSTVLAGPGRRGGLGYPFLLTGVVAKLTTLAARVRRSDQPASLQRAAALHANSGICQPCRAKSILPPAARINTFFSGPTFAYGTSGTARVSEDGALYTTMRSHHHDRRATCAVVAAGPSDPDLTSHLLQSRRSRGEDADVWELAGRDGSIISLAASSNCSRVHRASSSYDETHPFDSVKSPAYDTLIVCQQIWRCRPSVRDFWPGRLGGGRRMPA